MASNMSGTASSNSSLYYDYYSDEYSSSYDSDSSEHLLNALLPSPIQLTLGMVSTNSTPNKQGATGVQHRTRDNMDAALQKDLFDRTLRDEPIEDFVKYVYGFTDDDAKYIGSNIWTLHSDGLKEFDTVLREGRPEKELYAPFKTIIDDLCTKFESDGYTLHIGLAPLGDEQLRGTGTPRKPDGLFLFESFKENVTKVSWALSKGFLEFGITPKKRRIRKEERRPRDRIVTIREETTSTPSASEVAIDVGATVSQNDLAPSPPLEIQSGSKRRSSDSFEKSVKRSMQLEEAVPASPEQDLWIPLNEEVLDSDEDELPVIESHLPPVQVNPPPLDESEIDFETMGGCLTFEKFLAALGQRPRQYNS
ncbi:hypothetical protein EYR36_010460 [Pleurotus pulmonarius]|nr:hypothetical protein EYR36_010460 [Pleurotus pulmonarius]